MFFACIICLYRHPYFCICAVFDVRANFMQSSLQSRQKELERQQATDALKKNLAQRPERVELVDRKSIFRTSWQPPGPFCKLFSACKYYESTP